MAKTKLDGDLLAVTKNLLVGVTTDNGVDKLQVNGSARISGPITVSSPFNYGTFNSNTPGSAYINLTYNGAAYAYIGQASGTTGGSNLDLGIRAEANLAFGSSGVERMRIDVSGNLLVGVASGTTHCIKKTATEGNGVLIIGAGSGGDIAAFYACGGFAWNNAATGMVLAKNSGTGRSINAAGTINASGADYAEYMLKSASCGTLAKGSIVGVNVAGELTDLWADAISFMVKTTNPSYVGGDSWGAGLEGAELEAARATVDRIAFAGQVPVNVQGATPGQFVVPVQDGMRIGGITINEDDLTLKQYIKAVGIVQNILPDGRANIRVKVA